VSLAIDTITNHYIKGKLKEVPKEVAKGKSLAEVLKTTGVFPSLFVGLLATGERSGELERTLELLEKLYDQQAMRKINLWTRLAEPIAMLIIGILVAFVVLSVVLPLTEISSGVKR
jgi:type IV pilus assembly protein PilC